MPSEVDREASTIGPEDEEPSAVQAHEHLPVKPIARYQMVGKLGEGGMAEVFLALQRSVAGFEKLVVIKRILPELSREQTALIDMHSVVNIMNVLLNELQYLQEVLREAEPLQPALDAIQRIHRDLRSSEDVAADIARNNLDRLFPR